MSVPPSVQRAIFLGGLGLLAGLLVGCAPDPVYRLDARAPDSSSIWQRGRQVVTHTVDSVQVAVAYARTTDPGHKFRIAFVNRSSSSVTVDPLGIYAVVTEKLSTKERVKISRYDEEVPNYVYRRDTLSTADTMDARNPERRLLEIDKERARAEAEAANDRATNALFLTLDAVSEIAAGPQTPEERTADATADTQYRLERAEERAENRRTQARLSQRRAQWAQSALRRTTLVPGMRTSGFVIVPMDPRAYTLVLHVEHESGVVTVPFRQTRYKP
ncbi:MAG TPA: hypothetical protein VJ884_06290 [Salinibacter sp.]|nr:hypothetical protein [Salinibacter sp.]